jgi:hypothetical protein
MSMNKKLMRAYIQGCEDTWKLVEQAAKTVPGIGEKTQQKLMDAIREMARKEVKKRFNQTI